MSAQIAAAAARVCATAQGCAQRLSHRVPVPTLRAVQDLGAILNTSGPAAFAAAAAAYAPESEREPRAPATCCSCLHANAAIAATLQGCAASNQDDNMKIYYRLKGFQVTSTHQNVCPRGNSTPDSASLTIMRAEAATFLLRCTAAARHHLGAACTEVDSHHPGMWASAQICTATAGPDQFT
jgi:hypothetical protein